MPDQNEPLNREAVLDLIELHGTLNQASAFLKRRGLTHSAGSWADMRAKRIRPALDSGALDDNDLLELLTLCEEHGNQHVFTYWIEDESYIPRLFDVDAVEARLASSDRLPPLNQHQFVDMPDEKTVVNVRYDENGDLVFKIVEKRFFRSNKSENHTNGQVVITYDTVSYRAVHIVRVQQGGQVDVRVYSARDAISYEVEAGVILDMVTTILDRRKLSVRPLDGFRNVIWAPDRRAEVSALVAVNNSDHRNHDGSRLRAATAMLDRAIFDDDTLTESVDHFHAGEGDGYCERASLTVLATGSEGALSRDVHVALLGAEHEFLLPSKVTKREFDYILHLLSSDYGEAA